MTLKLGGPLFPRPWHWSCEAHSALSLILYLFITFIWFVYCALNRILWGGGCFCFFKFHFCIFQLVILLCWFLIYHVIHQLERDAFDIRNKELQENTLQPRKQALSSLAFQLLSCEQMTFPVLQLLTHHFFCLSLSFLCLFSQDNYFELPESHHWSVPSKNMLYLQRGKGPGLSVLCCQCLGLGNGISVSMQNAHACKINCVIYVCL